MKSKSEQSNCTFPKTEKEEKKKRLHRKSPIPDSGSGAWGARTLKNGTGNGIENPRFSGAKSGSIFGCDFGRKISCQFSRFKGGRDFGRPTEKTDMKSRWVFWGFWHLRFRPHWSQKMSFSVLIPGVKSESNFGNIFRSDFRRKETWNGSLPYTIRQKRRGNRKFWPKIPKNCFLAVSPRHFMKPPMTPHSDTFFSSAWVGAKRTATPSGQTCLHIHPQIVFPKKKLSKSGQICCFWGVTRSFSP